MRKLNADNERTKHRYFIYLREAQRFDEKSVDMVAKAIARFETYTKWADFKRFRIEQATAFKQYLAKQKSEATGAPLSKGTLHSTLSHLKRFFHWLAGQPGYRSRFSYSDADYFNLSAKEVRIAGARRPKGAPTLQQLEHVLAQMPAETDIELRNRAVVAFILLTGARDGAVASARLKHVDLDRREFYQDAREVKTKASKSFSTFLFPVSPQAAKIVADWITHLRVERLWGDDDPLFPATDIALNFQHHFVANGIKRQHWSNATPIRKAFRAAFEAVGLPNFGPHSVRRTLAGIGERICRTPEDFKAWSQNLGHESVLTTFSSYGEVPVGRQAELIARLAVARNAGSPEIDSGEMGSRRR